MPNAAVICELNPLHNGHAEIFAAARSFCGENGRVIAIMSGNFVERGEIAVIDKWARAAAAVKAGADAVIEIPSKFAASSAQFFAEAGVGIAEKLGFIDYLVFGSECGDIEKLRAFSEFSAEHVTSNMTGGTSYASAVALAVGESPSSNDILAAEYVKALKKAGSSIRPVPVKRVGEASENSLESYGKFASASFIRNALPDLDSVRNFLPDYSFDILKDTLDFYGNLPENSIFDQYITAKLRELGPDGLRRLPFVTEGLENKIYREAMSGKPLSEIVDSCTSRRYTKSRIKRILISVITGANKKDFENALKNSAVCINVPYLRVLAVKKEKREILALISKNSPVPVFAGNFPAAYEDIFRAPENEFIKETIRSEILATDLYFLAMKNQEARKGGRELSTPLIIV